MGPVYGACGTLVLLCFRPARRHLARAPNSFCAGGGHKCWVAVAAGPVDGRPAKAGQCCLDGADARIDIPWVRREKAQSGVDDALRIVKEARRVSSGTSRNPTLKGEL